MNSFISLSRAASSGARSLEEGCTVAITRDASGESRNSPRCCVMRKSFPNSACAAVAPMQIITSGRMAAISASSQGAAGGDLRGARLFVNAAFPARFPFEMLHGICDVNFRTVNSGFFKRDIEQSSGRPDKRLPLQIFVVSRLSPASMVFALCGPSPNTVCVARFQSSQALQSSAAFRSSSREECAGNNAGCGVIVFFCHSLMLRRMGLCGCRYFVYSKPFQA